VVPTSAPSRAAPAPWAIVEASFVAAAQTTSALPAPEGAELAFAGRSNVGKSSLMNMLLGRRRLVRTSNTPGCTRQVAFFRARARDGALFQLVDLPGYGYARRAKSERVAWARLCEDYLAGREVLRAVVLLVDARLGPTETDRALLAFLETRARSKPRVVVVATKIDKLPPSRRRAEVGAIGRALGLPVVGASALTGEGAEDIWRSLRAAALGAASSGTATGTGSPLA